MVSRPPRVILTGAPGAGKTVLLHALEQNGFTVVGEAATDVIALAQAQGVDAPWLQADFIDEILRLQILRADRVIRLREAVFFDRSPLCTLALARHLGVTPSHAWSRDLDKILAEDVYDRRVIFVGSLGFITPTPARRIGLEEAARFADLHREVYQSRGFELIELPAAPVKARVRWVRDTLALDSATPAGR